MTAEAIPHNPARMRAPSLACALRARSFRASGSLACTLLSAVMCSACDVNRFDATQVPIVSATSTAGAPLVVSWTPDGAQLVRVYRGAEAGDGYGPNLVWSVAATGKNTLRGPLSYGATPPTGGMVDVPPTPLVRDEVYVVQITRADPKGTGDGFTNTSNRYVGITRITVQSP